MYDIRCIFREQMTVTLTYSCTLSEINLKNLAGIHNNIMLEILLIINMNNKTKDVLLFNIQVADS